MYTPTSIATETYSFFFFQLQWLSYMYSSVCLGSRCICWRWC